MLTGRESLKRVIGKRRRYLPNRHWILSSYVLQTSLVIKEEQNDGISPVDALPERINLNGGSEWINCPVCSTKIRGRDEVINFHLDTCLARGTKRKLSQQTLFQLNFCSRSKAKTCTSEGDNLIVTDSFERNSEQTALGGNTDKSSDSETQEDYINTENELSPASIALKDDLVSASVGRRLSDPELSTEVDLPLFPLEGKMLGHDRTKRDDEVLSEISLETYIVGRRFANGTEVNVGAKISVSRDFENPKDANAMKVIAAGCGSGGMLGFLPREVAQHLSPLVDKFNLCFEGYVTCVPKQSLSAIPLQILCKQVSPT